MNSDFQSIDFLDNVCPGSFKLRNAEILGGKIRQWQFEDTRGSSRRAVIGTTILYLVSCYYKL